jgi:hypothetical protein
MASHPQDMNALSDRQFRCVCAGPSLLLSAPHDHMFTRTNYTSGIPSLSVTNVRNVLESCDNRVRRTWVLGSDGTRNRCKLAITVAELLLSAKDRRIWRNGYAVVCKSLIQKPKLVRQVLQRYGSNLLSCMLLCLNPVFCSYVEFRNMRSLWPGGPVSLYNRADLPHIFSAAFSSVQGGKISL